MLDDESGSEQPFAERLRQVHDILDGTGAGAWEWHIPSGALQVNARWAEILGHRLEALLPVTYGVWKSMVHGDDYARTEAAVAAHLSGNTERYDCEYRMRHASGAWIWVHSSGKVRSRGADATARRMFGTFLDITARKQAQQNLMDSELAQRLLYEATPAMLYSIDAQGNLLSVSNLFAQTLGYSRAEMIGKKPTVFMTQASAQHALQTVFPEFLRQGFINDVPYQLVQRNGQIMDVLVSAVLERDAQGAPLRSLSSVTNITERLRSEQRLQRVLEGANQGYWDWNLQTNTFQVSARWETMLGYAPGELKVDPDNWPALVHPEDLPAAMASIERHIRGQAPDHEVELRVKTKRGDWKWILTSGRVVSWDHQGAPLMMSGTHTDISQQKAHRAELDRVAHFDPLTHLPNRRLLSDRLQQALLRSDRSGRSTAICFLDLDGFKTINDQFGHGVGDLVLVGVARHLGTVLRADDTLARLGGDEFVLLLSEIQSTEECIQILQRVLQTTRLPIQAEGQQLSISASIGVSLYPSDQADPDILLRHADMAMYQAKQAGKNRYQLFDAEMDRMAHARRAFLDQLERALDGGEFVLHYQPQVDLGSGQVVGTEALVRWQHPTRGLLAPAAFLSELNGSHLEARLGEWVIETALSQLRSWQALGLQTRVSVNISANHLLRADFCERLAQALARYPDLSAAQLELEVLETAAIGEMHQAVDILLACRNLGVRFALDDFGTGYSSLTYLRQLPVHTLKIDQSFVRDMLVDPDDLGIVRGIIELAKVFGRQVVAEGVETRAHGEALCALGCLQDQGYGIARALPARAIPAWCARWQETGEWAVG